MWSPPRRAVSCARVPRVARVSPPTIAALSFPSRASAQIVRSALHGARALGADAAHARVHLLAQLPAAGDALPPPSVLELVAAATDARVPRALRVAALALLLRCVVPCRGRDAAPPPDAHSASTSEPPWAAHAGRTGSPAAGASAPGATPPTNATPMPLSPAARAALSRSYGVLFARIEDVAVQRALVPLLCVLTERRHVRTFRVRILLRLYRASHDPTLLSLLDTYACYIPTLLQPAPPCDSRARDRAPDIRREPAYRRLFLAHWAASLEALVLPDVVPGLLVAPDAQPASCVADTAQLALLLGGGSAGGREPPRTSRLRAGRRLAASLGRILALNHVYAAHARGCADDGVDVPPFDPAAAPLLDHVYMWCTLMDDVPAPLFRFLLHVVHSVAADAVHTLSQTDASWPRWEAAWLPTLAATARLCSVLPPAPRDEIDVRLLRPLCHIATLDCVSDRVSAGVVRIVTRLFCCWTMEMHAPDADVLPLARCLLHLEAALVMDGTPSLCVYDALLAAREALALAARAEAAHAFFPFPFLVLAVPTGRAQSAMLLARLCGYVHTLRTHVAAAQTHGVAPGIAPAPTNDMIACLVDMLWSGRAFAVFLQRGLIVNGVTACDRTTMAAIKQACDELRVVPFALTASMSHGALLAALFERFTNHALLPPDPGRPFVHAPITPSALRVVREEHGLPAHLQYTQIREQFLAWLAECGAPQLLELLSASVPSLAGAGGRKGGDGEGAGGVAGPDGR
ncbi:hypothetical protein MSPP1_001726 [Malassezia sp. CBS 17886]|nr:hypothetical protein MSPP1_001726 [Malassezia sp. CBS 17886]